MSYRNDHEATLHRVDALESELEALQLAYERQRSEQPNSEPPRTSSARGWLALLVFVGIATTGTVTALRMLTPASDEPAPEVAATTPPASTTDLDRVRTCLRAIAPRDTALDARSADPRGATRAPVRSVLATGASCRPLLASFASCPVGVDGLDREVRERIADWSAAEDTLVGEIESLIAYYDADAYAADDYASAPQHWATYDRAISARDLTLTRLAPLL